MKTNEQLMKACQIGCNNLNDANNLLAECYGRIGKIAEENERLRERAKTIGELEQLAARSNNNLLVENDRLREENERLRKDAERYQWFRVSENWRDSGPFDDLYEIELDSAIDAARGAK